MRAASAIRSARRRPLAPLKLVFYGGCAGLTLAAATPRMAVLASVVRGPFVDAPELPHPIVWPAVALLSIAVVILLAVDAAGGPLVSRRWLAAQIVALAAVAMLPPCAAERRGSSQVEGLLFAARDAVERGIAPAFLETALREELPRTSFRGRTAVALAPSVRVLAGRVGPVLRPLPGDAPGTVYLALAPGGRSGWATGLTLARTGAPEVLSRQGAPVIVPLAFPEVSR